MTQITTDAAYITLINVFTVIPARQAELIELLDAATADVMRHCRGLFRPIFTARWMAPG
ncbi:hypothetical protein ABIB57_002986 [Devosia sp. UYZn731]|uniref:hypothetical protein n=1 Tax=Devosia sp. UYZn731 TaxID=3156345 RepID=UPI0033999CD3